MTAQDLQLNCGIRSVLCRHWIDLTKTSFFARRGHVHLSGEVSVIGPSRAPEDTANTLKAFEAELRRLREVKTISFDFTNWIRDDSGVWICLEDQTPAPPEQRSGGDAPGIVDLSTRGGKT
jgi:hypothetical protein